VPGNVLSPSGLMLFTASDCVLGIWPWRWRVAAIDSVGLCVGDLAMALAEGWRREAKESARTLELLCDLELSKCGLNREAYIFLCSTDSCLLLGAGSFMKKTFSFVCRGGYLSGWMGGWTS